MTIVWSVLIAMIGHIILIVAALPGVIEHPHGSVAAFAMALIIMGIGSMCFIFALTVALVRLKSGRYSSQLVVSKLAFLPWSLNNTRSLRSASRPSRVESVSLLIPRIQLPGMFLLIFYLRQPSV